VHYEETQFRAITLRRLHAELTVRPRFVVRLDVLRVTSLNDQALGPPSPHDKTTLGIQITTNVDISRTDVYM